MAMQAVLDRLAALARRHGNVAYAVARPAVSAVPKHETPSVAPAQVRDCLLFPASRGAASRPLFTLLLPPPPVGSDRVAFRRWLAGKPHAPLAPALALIDIPTDDLIEAEVSLFGTGSLAPLAAGSRLPGDPVAERTDAAWLRDLAPPAADPDPTGALECFAAGLRAAIEAFEPETAAALRVHGATLRVHAELATLLAHAQATEAAWLADGPAGGSRPQDIRGAVFPGADLREPTVLRRSAFLHLLASRPVPSGLRDALVETRFAQACARLAESTITPGQIEALIPTAPAGESLDDMLFRLARSTTHL